MTPLLHRSLLVCGLLSAGVALCVHTASCDSREGPAAEHIVPITVESGFWGRASGEVVMGSIPPDVVGESPGDRWRIDPKTVRVLSPAGTDDVPFRLSFGDSGLPDRLAFALTAPLPPLSAVQYSLRFRRSQSTADQPAEVAGADADFPWPSNESQLMRQRNGDFETGDEEADGWSLIRGEVSTEDPHGGRRCMKLHKTEQDDKHPMLSSQPFPISPDARYIFKLRARGEKIGEEGYIIAASLYFLDGDKRTVKTKPWRANVGSRGLPNEWTMVSASASAPPETRYGQVRVLMYGARGTLWVDDVEVVCPVSAQPIPATIRFETAKQSPPEPGK